MTDINVTEFLASIDCAILSGSVVELGDNAGRITWRNSIEAVRDFDPLPSDDLLQEFREWLKPWGGWDDAEIAAMSDEHLRALCIQWIAGDWRECFDCSIDDADWESYETLTTDGQCPGSFYRDNDGQIFWSVGH